MRPFTCLCACLITCVSLASAEQRPPAATVETAFVGTMPGSLWTVPLAINNKGQVVGFAAYEVGSDEVGYQLHSMAFLWSARTGFQLISEDAMATDINERGDVTLLRYNCLSDECLYARGAVWSARTGVFTELGRMYPMAINNRGDVAGMCRITDYGRYDIYGQATACVVSQYGVREWQCEQDDSYYYCAMWATAINDRGDIVVERSWEDEGSISFLVPANGNKLVPIGDLHFAQDINNAGTIVGVMYADGLSSPAIWTRNGANVLPGGIQGRASDVNNRGWIVGNGWGGSFPSALVWTGSATPTSLAPSGPAIVTALNDRGQVVGVTGGWPTNEPYGMVVWTVRAGGAQGAR